MAEKETLLGRPSRIDARNRIVVNAEVLELLDVREGDYIVFTRSNGHISVKKAALAIVE